MAQLYWQCKDELIGYSFKAGHLANLTSCSILKTLQVGTAYQRDNKLFQFWQAVPTLPEKALLKVVQDRSE